MVVDLYSWKFSVQIIYLILQMLVTKGQEGEVTAQSFPAALAQFFALF